MTLAEAEAAMAAAMERVTRDGGRALLAYLDELLTVDEVAAWCRVEPATVYRWACEGSGPARVKVGAGVRYRRSDVRAWLQERTVEPERRAVRRYRRVREVAS